MTDAVLADAQFGVARVLRPFEGFENVYQGRSVLNSILLPGGYDRDAGKPGISPNLTKGLPVPFGSKVVVWLPTIRNPNFEEPVPIPYAFKVLWRLRNLRDFRESRLPYHFPKQSIGGGNRFVIPAAKKAILYEGQRQLTDIEESFTETQASLEEIQVTVSDFQLSAIGLMPDGSSAIVEQGLSGVDRSVVTFTPVQLDAEGDEMIILMGLATSSINRDNPRSWNFEAGEVDAPLLDFFNRSPDLGVYIFTGSNP